MEHEQVDKILACDWLCTVLARFGNQQPTFVYNSLAVRTLFMVGVMLQSQNITDFIKEFFVFFP